MKFRLVEHIKNNPRVELMPDSGEFDGINGFIEVSFFDFDDDGRRVYRPLVRGNVGFSGRMNPEDSHYWGECFIAAYDIAVRKMPLIRLNQVAEIKR